MKHLLFFLSNKHNNLLQILLFVGAVGLITLCLPRQSAFNYSYFVGKPWQYENLYAPFDFAINKTDTEIAEEKLEIERRQNRYFNFDIALAERKQLIFLDSIDLYYQNNNTGNQPPRIEHESVKRKALEILQKNYSIGIVSPTLQEFSAGNAIVYLVRNKQAEAIDIRKLKSTSEVISEIQAACFDSNPLFRDYYQPFWPRFVEPNVQFDKSLTDIGIQQNIDGLSLARGLVASGELIVEKGQLIDQERKQILDSIKSEYERQMGADAVNRKSLVIAYIALVTILLGLLMLFVILLRKDILDDLLRLSFLLLPIVVVVYITSLSTTIEWLNIYLIPFCILPIIIRILYDTRLALFAYSITLIICGLIAPTPYEFYVIQFIGGTVCMFSLVNLRKRSQLFITIFLLLISYVAADTCMTVIVEGRHFSENWDRHILLAGSAAFTLFSYPLIYLIEKIFGFTSDISLLELSDTNNKLLKELALKAPGTFQHSLQVANLAEAAIIRIGGNSLLARTGALYHDIGKMDIARYFIENQVTGINPHDELSNEESAQIIISHVLRGIKMAKKNRLPESIIDFIRTHHGTSMVLYFYRSEKSINPEAEIDSDSYTYPGPIPFSRETAVVMIADSVEATARSLKKVDSDTIDALVERIVNEKINNEQLINADITLKDITLIKKTMKRMLMNMYHVRIEYPK